MSDFGIGVQGLRYGLSVFGFDSGGEASDVESRSPHVGVLLYLSDKLLFKHSCEAAATAPY